MDDNQSYPSPSTPPTVGPAPDAPIRDRVLDLVALFCLIALATIVFVLAGSEAFTAVTGVGMVLFTTWRGRLPRP